MKKFRKASAEHPESHMELRYEELATDPEKKFDELCIFLGIPTSTVPFDFYLRRDEALEMYPKEILEKYQASLFKKIDTSRIGLWKEKLSISETRVGDNVAGRIADDLGYIRQYKQASMFIHLRALPGICAARLLSLTTSIVDTFPYRMRMAILIKAPWVIGRIYLSIFNRKKLKEVSLAKRKMEPRQAK